ncbi:B12-binding domain-containing radical SAM protein [Candidatus Electronema sp. JC]|uniref:B12-binding domain-containing radical SAM protein n=1 Tax=Candidatus Electronema sp. JC TaxID=3401570 RepID=UPI003B437E7F
MRISFINPPYLKHFSRPQRSPAVTKSGTLYYPLWLATAAGYAEAGGHEIDLIDAPAADLSSEAVVARVKALGSRLAVVETSTPSISNDAQFCETLKKAAQENGGDIFIVLVGTHVSALPAESLRLNAAVDAVAQGEYDATIRELAAALESGGDISKVAGLWLRQGEQIINTGSREPLHDLDSVPFVSSIYKRFLQPEHYFNPNALFPMVTITTSRGCPHRCFFCVYPQTMMGHRLRVRSVGNVVDELEHIVSKFPEVKAVFFEDDTFPAQKARCIAICEEIIRRGIRISWTANARVDLDLETMLAMKKAGCRCLCVGFESGNQQLLDAMRKGITLAQSEQFMRAAKQAGILVHGCFMVGLPGETMETMEKTLEFAIKLRPDAIQMYPVMVYPGTEAYSWYEQRGLIATKDFARWLTPSGLHNTVIRGENLTAAELVAFCDHARKKFYLRPGYLLYKAGQMLRHPSEMRKTLKSARTFAKYLLFGSDLNKEAVRSHA